MEAVLASWVNATLRRVTFSMLRYRSIEAAFAGIGAAEAEEASFWMFGNLTLTIQGIGDIERGFGMRIANARASINNSPP